MIYREYYFLFYNMIISLIIYNNPWNVFSTPLETFDYNIYIDRILAFIIWVLEWERMNMVA